MILKFNNGAFAAFVKRLPLNTGIKFKWWSIACFFVQQFTSTLNILIKTA